VTASIPSAAPRAAPSVPPVLEVADLRAGYGDVPVLRGVSLEVGAGEIVALVAGLVTPSGGAVRFEGAPVTGLPTHRIVARGLLLVPEGRRIFPSLTVQENLELGAYLPAAKARRAESLGRTLELFPVLAERRRQAAGTLSGGEQQMLAIGRSLMGWPRLLMLDEPSLGLAPLVADRIFEVIQRISAEATPVLLVEQNVRRSLQIARRAYVLEHGAVVLAGMAGELQVREDVRRVYLGL
jgi:branched-chain amino acid transport system ATP-binding protein